MSVAKKKTVVRWSVAAFVIVGAVLLLNLFVNHDAQGLVRDMIAEHFHSEVQLDELHIRLLPSVRISGKGLMLVQKSQGTNVPFIKADQFEASTSFWNMFSRTRHLHHVQVHGLIITVVRHASKEEQPKARRKVPEFNIDRLVSDNATLVIMPRDPAKRSLVYNMHHLEVDSLGKSEVMRYRAHLQNALPPGDIDAEGNLGPWNFEDTGSTHVEGHYDFKKADLGVFHEISGTLSSTGDFQGELSRLDVVGTTDTPDFAVSAGEHPVALKTKFQATVDGTNGNTELKMVEAQFLNSSFTAQGLIYDIPGPQGHIITLEVNAKKARVEDMLKMAVKTPPAMQGELKFHAKVKINPGSTPVRNRIDADGQASIANAYFRSKTVSEKIAELSHKGAHELNASNDERIPARFKTTFHLANGTLKLPMLDFNVPGAETKLHGSYEINTQILEFRGVAMLQAKPSQMTTGFKSLLLKAADPFFKTKNAGTVLPIAITGKRTEPKFHVELKRLKEAKKEASAN